MVISRLSKLVALCSLLFVGLDSGAMLKKITPLAQNFLGKNFSSTVNFPVNTNKFKFDKDAKENMIISLDPALADEIFNAHTFHKKYAALTISDFEKTTAIEDLTNTLQKKNWKIDELTTGSEKKDQKIAELKKLKVSTFDNEQKIEELTEKVRDLNWKLDELTTKFTENLNRGGESCKMLNQVNNNLKKSTKVAWGQVKQLKEETKNIGKQLTVSKNMYEKRIADLEKKYDLKISNLEKEQTKTIGEFKEKITQINKEREEERAKIVLTRKKDLDNLNKQLERIEKLTNKVLKIDDNKKHTDYVKTVEQTGIEIEKLENRTEEYIRKEKEKKDSENKKQYGWWDTAKWCMYTGLACVTTAVIAVWYSHTRNGEKLYDKTVHCVPAILLQRILKNALLKRDLDKIRGIIKNSSNKKLYKHLDGEELAKCALKKNVDGKDFAAGLELLLEAGIIRFADPYAPIKAIIRFGDGEKMEFRRCTIDYNVLEYVESVDAFNLLVKYAELLTTKLRSEKNSDQLPLLFDVKELINRRNKNGDTIRDLYNRLDKSNSEKNALIKSVTDAGGRESQEMCDDVAKNYLNRALVDISDIELNNAIIAQSRGMKK